MYSWFAVYVKARHEKTVSSILTTKGLQTCLPLIQSERNWCDRTKMLDMPAFPGYVFCEFDPEYRAAVLSTPSVVSIVGSGRRPIPVEHSEIDSLMTIQRAKCLIRTWPYLQTGAHVRIEGGALDGLTGILSRCRKDAKVIVSVALLQRSIAVEVDRSRVVPVFSTPTPLLTRPQIAQSDGPVLSRVV